MLLSEEPHATDLLFHVLWVHGKGPTSLKHNQYIGVLSIQSIEHLSCGTRFGENRKATMPSSGLSMLLHEEPHAMDALSPIPHVLLVYVQGTTSMGYNQCTMILFIMMRMVRCDHGAERYEFENPFSFQWGEETIYMLTNASDFKDVLGDFIVANIE